MSTFINFSNLVKSFPSASSLSVGGPLLLPLVGVSLLGNLLTFLGFTFNGFSNFDGEIPSLNELGEMHDEIVTPFEEFDDAYEYFTSAEVQDYLINEYDIDNDVLTAPVDDTIIEAPTVKQVLTENSSFPPDIQARLKIFQEEYQLEDDELDLVVEMILAESRMMEVGGEDVLK